MTNRAIRLSLAVALMAVPFFAAGAVHAGVTVFEKGDANLKVGGLLQTQCAFSDESSPSGDFGTDFYVRRMRLMVYGRLNNLVNFFIETDSPNFGRGGDYEVSVFIQDAFVELNLHPSFQFDVGMLLVPFSHHGMQGATSLLAVDYHGGLIKYPPGSHKVWRDFGVMFRGLLLSDRLEYRVGVFDGVEGDRSIVDRQGAEGNWRENSDYRNPDDWPRATARLTLNLFDPEGGAGVGGMFYDGIYLSKSDDGFMSTKKVLSFGASLDWQRDLNVTLQGIPAPAKDDMVVPLRGVEEYDDYFAFAADAFWDIPLGADKRKSLNGQVNFVYFSHGDENSDTGYGLLSEVGFRYNAFQPLVILDWFDSTKTGEDGDYLGVFGGLNYWMFGHSVNFKAQAGAASINGDDFKFSGTAQVQLLF